MAHLAIPDMDGRLGLSTWTHGDFRAEHPSLAGYPGCPWLVAYTHTAVSAYFKELPAPWVDVVLKAEH